MFRQLYPFLSSASISCESCDSCLITQLMEHLYLHHSSLIVRLISDEILPFLLHIYRSPDQQGMDPEDRQRNVYA